MTDMDSWQKVLDLKQRVSDIRLEIARLERFMQNPFANSQSTPVERKKQWEKAARKKRLLKNEMIAAKIEIAQLVEEHKEESRKKKK